MLHCIRLHVTEISISIYPKWSDTDNFIWFSLYGDNMTQTSPCYASKGRFDGSRSSVNQPFRPLPTPKFHVYLCNSIGLPIKQHEIFCGHLKKLL